LNRLLALFDYPDPNLHADRRLETTTPLQKLFVLNSPFLMTQSQAVAERTLPPMADARSLDPPAQIEAVYRAVLGRAPTSDERALALSFVSQQESSGPAAWRQLAHVLLASNEFLFID
jgi:hypothetical protein